MNKIKETLGFTNFFDYYDLQSNLGEGSFGLVKLATHKKSGQQVAIKTIKKKDKNSQ